jgi:hypothetical protein
VANGSAAQAAEPGALHGGSRERNMPRAVLGTALVAVCALAGGYLWINSSANAQVLRLTTRVAAGQAITASDLSGAQVSAGSGSGLIPVSDESLVLGRTAAVTLVAGGFLTSAQIGSGALPKGQAVVEVDVKFGAYPTDLAPGDLVAVSSVASSGSGSAAGAGPLSGDPQATVVTVTASSSGDGSAGVELSASAAAAASINAIPAGQGVLAVISPQGA